ncbi:dolichol-phosphate mannosyltransferase subunit 3 [Backusella circina FSU 941]|nr:dolichol-phosphate mannosyltransferase subunit 3 [Backusella circina FSU 941]
MTRATEAFTTAAIASVIYLVLYLGFVPLPETIQNKIVPVFPWWVLMTFGCYCLANLGNAVFTFRNCPEAYNELMNEISMAKSDLNSKGMRV